MGEGGGSFSIHGNIRCDMKRREKGGGRETCANKTCDMKSGVRKKREREGKRERGEGIVLKQYMI